MALDFLATIYTDPELGGNSRFLGGGDSHRSDGDNANELATSGFWHFIRSLQLSTSASTDANFLLFKNGDYSGPFLQVTLAKGEGVGSWNITGGDVGSVCAIATGRLSDKEVRQSARQQLEAQWTTFLDQKLGGTPVSREGGPAMAWEAFPHIIHLDPALVYLRITQALHISIEWWADYAASMTYHLFPFINEEGHVRVWGARWGLWVEDGAKKAKIHAQLWPQIEAGLGQLATQVNAKLAALDPFGVQREVYLLPGNQVGVTGATGTLSGNTNDDATIVVVR